VYYIIYKILINIAFLKEIYALSIIKVAKLIMMKLKKPTEKKKTVNPYFLAIEMGTINAFLLSQKLARRRK
jgi:hypothetical protein